VSGPPPMAVAAWAAPRGPSWLSWPRPGRPRPFRNANVPFASAQWQGRAPQTGAAFAFLSLCPTGSQRLLHRRHLFEPLLRMLQSRVLPSQRSIIVYLMRRRHAFSFY
jgi:hypothetical protein